MRPVRLAVQWPCEELTNQTPYGFLGVPAEVVGARVGPGRKQLIPGGHACGERLPYGALTHEHSQLHVFLTHLGHLAASQLHEFVLIPHLVRHESGKHERCDLRTVPGIVVLEPIPQQTKAITCTSGRYCLLVAARLLYTATVV